MKITVGTTPAAVPVDDDFRVMVTPLTDAVWMGRDADEATAAEGYPLIVGCDYEFPAKLGSAGLWLSADTDGVDVRVLVVG